MVELCFHVIVIAGHSCLCSRLVVNIVCWPVQLRATLKHIMSCRQRLLVCHIGRALPAHVSWMFHGAAASAQAVVVEVCEGMRVLIKELRGFRAGAGARAGAERCGERGDGTAVGVPRHAASGRAAVGSLARRRSPGRAAAAPDVAR